MDYRGDDIKNKKGIKSQDDCAKFCVETKGCLFWTYQAKTKGCWVKTANSKKIEMAGVVSGNRECGLTGDGEGEEEEKADAEEEGGDEAEGEKDDDKSKAERS